MPTYCVKCDRCGWTGEILHGINEDHPKCAETIPLASHNGIEGELESEGSPPCGGTLETDVQAQGFPSVGATRAWEGSESRSMSLGVNPDQIPEQMRRTPSAKFDDHTGDMIFDNDSHQKRVFKEMNAADARETQQVADARGDIATDILSDKQRAKLRGGMAS